MNSVVIDNVVRPVDPMGTAATGPRFAGSGVAGTPRKPATWRRVLAFAGPGYMVAVGYMDPGNWATDIGGGAAGGYSLLSVVLLSSLMAMLLQAAAVRLGVASGMDLAQSCRRYFTAPVNLALWIGCEIAVVACNMAELLGMACGLGLLFHIPLVVGVLIAVADVMLILKLQSGGMRYLQALLIALMALIGACFALQLWWLHPPLTAIAAGFRPTTEVVTNPAMLYLAVGILGATVMPHNLYLHSSIVRSLPPGDSEAEIRQHIRYATTDSNLALAIAFFVNVAILVLAAGAFWHPGAPPRVLGLEDAHRLLSPILGTSAAGVIFGAALIASGLSSSITGTLAGQVVMEGFLDLRMSRPKRALLTRALAVVPTVAVTAWLGTEGASRLLVLSQVILGVQLPFAVVPLLWFTTRTRHLGPHAFRRSTGVLLWTVALVLVVVNVWAICEVC
ncbi:MAG TPA: Nramp family divalent metal transporter [Steroidobacteraceae bacterium]